MTCDRADRSNRELPDYVPDAHRSCCHHGHQEDGRETSNPIGEEPAHKHHFCIGTHVFYLTSSDLVFDFAPQFYGLSVLPNALTLPVTTAIGAVELSGAGSFLGDSSRRLRALLCVYRI